MKKLLSNGLAVIAGVVSVPAVVNNLGVKPAWEEYRQDPRLEHLQRFFERHDAPAKDFSEAFLQAADTHDLDWRLLPSICFVESTGGKFVRANNLFGWDSGRAEFDSMIDAIHAVADRLANSRRYRDKSLDELLRMYNPDENYPGKVKSIMRRIGPSEL